MRIYPRDNWPFKLIEEPAVTQQLVAARERWPRFDDVWEGLCWLIGHAGHKIGAQERPFGNVGHYVYTVEGDAEHGLPRVVVVYRWGVGSFVIRMIVVSAPIAAE